MDKELVEAVARAMRHMDKAKCETSSYAEYAQAALSAIMETHAIVPREPTDAMLASAHDKVIEGKWTDAATAVYKAMLAAYEGEG